LLSTRLFDAALDARGKLFRDTNNTWSIPGKPKRKLSEKKRKRLEDAIESYGAYIEGENLGEDFGTRHEWILRGRVRN
jgi:hypothetical protein